MKIINKNTRQNKIKCLNLSLSLSLWRICECKNTIDAARERNTNAALGIARTISHHLRLRISIGNFLISSSYFLFTLNLNLRSPDVVILSVGYGSNKFLFWTPCHAIIFFFFYCFWFKLLHLSFLVLDLCVLYKCRKWEASKIRRRLRFCDRYIFLFWCIWFGIIWILLFTFKLDLVKFFTNCQFCLFVLEVLQMKKRHWFANS